MQGSTGSPPRCTYQQGGLLETNLLMIDPLRMYLEGEYLAVTQGLKILNLVISLEIPRVVSLIHWYC